MLQPYFIVQIKHGLFPSLCTGDNHGTVLELSMFYLYGSKQNVQNIHM